MMGKAIDKGILMWHISCLLKLTVVTRILAATFVEKEGKILDLLWCRFLCVMISTVSQIGTILLIEGRAYPSHLPFPSSLKLTSQCM